MATQYRIRYKRSHDWFAPRYWVEEYWPAYNTWQHIYDTSAYTLWGAKRELRRAKRKQQDPITVYFDEG